MASLFGTQVVLVDDVAGVGAFLSAVLDCESVLIEEKPVAYGMLPGIVLVKRGGLDSSVLAAFDTVSVTRLFVDTPSSIDKTMHVIEEAGKNLRVFERSQDVVVVEGPEKITIHIVHLGNEDNAKKMQSKHVVESLVSVFGENEGEGQEEQVARRRKRKLAIPTLDVSILSDNSKNFVPMPPNGVQEFPFETEFFKGTAVLAVLHETMDRKFEAFYPEGKRRQFEVQVQGKFKRLPEGEIYVGAEATNKMEMGWMTKSFSNMALKFAGTMVNDLHYSFGEDQSLPDYEIPHVVAPMFPTLDKILVSAPGEPLPVMGVPFNEDPEYRKKRLKWRQIKDAGVDLDTVYSFSVNTSNVGLPNWELCNVPMVNPMSLCDFMGDSSVRLVAYEIPVDVVKTYPTHPQRFCNYVFNVLLNRVEPGVEEADVDLAIMSAEGEASDDERVRGTAGSAHAGSGATQPGGDAGIGAALTHKVDRKDRKNLRKTALGAQESDEGGSRLRDRLLSVGSFTGSYYNSDSAEEESRESLQESSDEASDDGELGADLGEEEQAESLRRTLVGGTVGDAEGEEDQTPKKSRFYMPSIAQARSKAETLRDSIGERLSRRGRNRESSRDGGPHSPDSPGTTTGSGTVGAFGSNIKGWVQGFTNNITIPTVVDLTEEKGAYQPPDHAFETSSSARFCPMVIEIMDKSLLNSSSSLMYLLPYEQQDTVKGGGSRGDAAGGSSEGEVATFLPRLRPYDEIARSLPTKPLPRLYKNGHMATVEKKRRQVVLAYKAMWEASAVDGQRAQKQRLEELLRSESDVDRKFLTEEEGKNKLFHLLGNVGKTVSRIGSKLGGDVDRGDRGESQREAADSANVAPSGDSSTNGRDLDAGEAEKLATVVQQAAWTGTAALAMSNRHWVQYLVVLTPDGFLLNHSSHHKPVRIPRKAIISAGRMKKEDVPVSLVGYSFLYVETLRKFYYFLVRDDHGKPGYLLQCLENLGVTRQRKFDDSDEHLEDTFSATLLVKTKVEIWRLNNRSLYNVRRFVFRGPVGGSHHCSPSEMVEGLLAKAIKLSKLMNRRNRSSFQHGSPRSSAGIAAESCTVTDLILQWLDFLDGVSDLQVIDIAGLPETQRAALLLNLYHTMVIHGSLVLFPPQTSKSWRLFFHEVAYLVSFDVMSMAELEHNIIKRTMTKPPRLVLGVSNRGSVPKSSYPGFALTNRDFRFNFCVNNGSLSMPGAIFVYKAETLDEQLDEMTSLVVQEALAVDESRRVVTLPTVCSWYALDFVPRGRTASHMDTLRVLAPYAKPDDKQKLTGLLLSGSAPTVKFRTFAYKSRILTLASKSGSD